MPHSRRVAKNFSGSPMPANASTGRPLSAASASASGSSRPWNTGSPRALRNRRDILSGRACSDHEQRIRAAELALKRRPQRPRREHHAVADAAAAIDHQDRTVFAQTRILETVVHHDRARARGARSFGAGGTVARHDRRRVSREQQRLVADIA